MTIEDAKGNQIVETNNPNGIMLQSTQGVLSKTSLPNIDPLDLTRFNFIGNHSDLEQKATVINWSSKGKFNVQFLNGGEGLVPYNSVVNKFNQSEEEGAELCIYCHFSSCEKRK